MRRWLEALALRIVPGAWRNDVARDLDEERPATTGTLWLIAHAIVIGARLRCARAVASARSARVTIPRKSPMQDFVRDIKLAIRGALRRPGYSLAVIATLAIGIGANTAIYSVFNWVLFRPRPGVRAPQELVTIRYQTPKRGGTYFVSYRDYADLRDGVTQSFVGVAVAGPRLLDLSTGGDPESVSGEIVTTNYFSLLGVTPVIGRDFEPAEEVPGGPASTIISHGLWRRSFKADASVLGRTLRLNGRPFTIVGVAPRGFQGRSHVKGADVWYTMSGHATMLPPGQGTPPFGEDRAALLTSRRSSMFGDAFARLRPGVTLAQAQAEADAVIANIPDFAAARAKPGTRSTIAPVLYPGIGVDLYAQERLTTLFPLLMGGVGLLLLLACANAANLLLARSTARSREIAVSQAIGATRFRIIRQQLAEGLVLSAAAGVAGLLLAMALTRLFDGMRLVTVLPEIKGITVDWRVSAFALTAALLTGLVFATAPAIASSRLDLQSSLKNGVTATRGGRRLLRGSLVTLQITVSVLLLIAAGLFVRTLQNIRNLDLGLQPEGLVSFTIQPSRFGFDNERAVAYIKALLQRIRDTPGISSAAFTFTTSFSPNRSELVFATPAHPDKQLDGPVTTVSPQFFSTMRIPLLAGREFTDADQRAENDTKGVVIISKRLADMAFGSEPALGGQLVLAYPKGKVVEVVGIAADVRGRSVTQTPEPWAYIPADQVSWGMIHARSALPEAQTIAAIRDAARSVDPVVAPSDIEVFGASIDRALAEQRLFARASAVFAAVAALLAGIGIYGMMSGTVAERRKEFGIRLALGARAGAVVRLVLRSSFTLAVIGLVAGLAGAAAMRRLVESRLYGVTPLDPATIAATITAILLIAILGSLVPAVRAARVDPVRSLRVE